MILRTVALTVAALLVGTLVWSHRAAFTAALDSPASGRRPVVFDNGTVRAPDVFVRATPTGIPIGSMRKCTRQRDTLYTERECPQGYAEARVGGDNKVTIMSSVAPTPSTPLTVPETSSAPRRKTLYEVLDMQADPQLPERMMQRAIGDGPAR